MRSTLGTKESFNGQRAFASWKILRKRTVTAMRSCVADMIHGVIPLFSGKKGLRGYLGPRPQAH